MKLLVVLLAAGIGVTSARAERVRVPTPLETLAAAAKCDDKASPWRPWCIATKFEQGTAAALPSKNLVGLTVALETGKDVATALRDRVTFVALAVTRDGTLAKLKLTDVTPESEAERTQVAEAVAAATLVFKGKAKTATLPKSLSEFVRSRTGTYDAKKTQAGWTWTGANPSELRKVGASWVLIETAPDNKGIWATILTDAWK